MNALHNNKFKMLQARLAGASAVAGLALYTLHVRRERNLQPSGRLLQFIPGSDDENIADHLQTGDLVLFARDPTLYAPLGAVVCAARKALTGTPFDQASIIVRRRGTPYVLEHTFSGVKLRRFDHRLQCCRSQAVLLRPLGLGKQLPPERLAALDSLLERVVPAADDASLHAASMIDDGYDANGNRIPVVTLRLLSAGAAGAALELLRLPLAPAANASVDLVAEVYSALGLALQQAPPPSAAPRRLAMPDLLPPQQPWADRDPSGPGTRGGRGGALYSLPVRVRDRLD